MASQRLRPGDGPNIVPIPDPAKRFDPLYLEAHSLVDRVPRDRLWRLIPLLRDAADPQVPAGALLKPVGQKIFPASPTPERQTLLAVSGQAAVAGKNPAGPAACQLTRLMARCLRWLQGRSRRTCASNSVTEDAVSSRQSSPTTGPGTAPYSWEREPWQ